MPIIRMDATMRVSMIAETEHLGYEGEKSEESDTGS